jgi:DNA-3-methyladenine glycosylase II
VFAPLVARQPGLRIVQSATVFEALTWAIIGQQINLPFAISLRRTFIEQAGRPHSERPVVLSGSAGCRPPRPGRAHQPQVFARQGRDPAARGAHGGRGRNCTSPRTTIPQVRPAALLAIKGIGPWTVNYTLLRGYGYADCSLRGRRGDPHAPSGRLLGTPEKPDQARTQPGWHAYSPHRTMAAAYLWASLNQPSG